MTDKDQKMRYSNAELETIKVTFNEDVLFLLRKFFLGGKLTVDEQKALTIFKDNIPAVEVLRKELLPVIDPDAPQFQLMDMYLTIEYRGKHPDEILCEARIRDVLIDYFDQKFIELTTSITSTITLQGLLSSKVEPLQRATNLAGRNMILFHLESHLNDFKVLATKKEETKEEQEERAKKDSVE
ncbi:hypothetical protein LCGC14_1879580 [marine sediment metagenome]|uniref:Uncharacterized protein n=1 Tax=marine sediment metagenome TaxID=412755 RepID=A0A0F9G2Q6_9ZZZZ